MIPKQATKHMKKNTIYNWLWKWHFIGGLVSFPIIFILALTGIIYLFKDQYEAPLQDSIRTVSIGKERLSYQEQWDVARKEWGDKVNGMVLPTSPSEATEFTAGRFSGKSSLFVNPYTGKVSGQVRTKDTDMFLVRKLHGELLLGSVGTKLVELIGSWMIVLIITGIFLSFPRQKKGWKQLFRIRRGKKDVFYRDLHKVGSFWFSLLLLLVLAGGMPWTDVFGNNFKWVQKKTDTGFPKAWQGRGINSLAQGEPIPLDAIVSEADRLNLKGEVKLSFPKSEDGVFSIHNTYHPDHSLQKTIHIDSYSGEVLSVSNWSDVGILMRGRMWAMAFHQGQFGTWNWTLMLIVAVALLGLSTSAIIAYTLKRGASSQSTARDKNHSLSYGIYSIVLIMCLLLPLFGLSVIAIIVYEQWRRWNSKRSGQREVSYR